MSTAPRLMSRGLALVIASVLVIGAALGTSAQHLPDDPATTWSLAAVGDAIITRPIMSFHHEGDARFSDLVGIIRGADAAFVNLEISLFRLSEFKGWPEVENGGNWELGPPEAAHDLKSMGFDLMNRANNHTTDYGVEGMRKTNELLDELGIVHAGSGMNLGQASRPGYLETPKGRIALIGLATTFTPMSRAGAARDDVMGRPGLSALRVETRHEVDASTMSTLRALASQMGGRVPTDPNAPLRLFNMSFNPGPTNRRIETVNEDDQARILREVRNAAVLADYVIVTSHSHEPGNDSQIPPDWLRAFAKACIDAGATTYIIHGPHQLRGIEVYKNRPVFYSLGNFIFQNETIDPMPSDHYEQFGLPDTALASDLYDARFKGGTTGFPSSPVWYESVVAVPYFRGREVTEIRLHPIDLAQKAPRSQRGTPRIAHAATGRAIIERIAKLSGPFGTTITYENGIGVWRAASARPTAGR
jgi:poly-gamma-glutamate capsule biosynthesis protein CapA/YwtB (metallophosphatase superfamily)